MGIPVSLESASGSPTKPWYYNLKISVSNIFRDFCGHLRKDSFCEHILGEKFKIDIIKLYYVSFAGNPDADSRLAGISILTQIDRYGGKFDFENDPYFPIWQKFGFCDKSANMADFSAKMRAKGGHYTFEPHLNNWNSDPWTHFSWKTIFEVTS